MSLPKQMALSSCQIANVACLEIEVSLWSYEPTIRNAVEYCGKNNIPVLAYSPLGRGFLTRKYAKPEDIPADSFLAHIPRFQGEAFYKNLELVDKLDEIAKKKGTSTSQLALAWLTSLNDMVRGFFRIVRSSRVLWTGHLTSLGSRHETNTQVIPIPGSSKASRVKDNTAAGNIDLSAEELKTINDTLEAAEIAGGRYPSQAEGALVSRLDLIGTWVSHGLIHRWSNKCPSIVFCSSERMYHNSHRSLSVFVPLRSAQDEQYFLYDLGMSGRLALLQPSYCSSVSI